MLTTLSGMCVPSWRLYARKVRKDEAKRESFALAMDTDRERSCIARILFDMPAERSARVD
jgi:hypothetical protein